MTINSKFMEKLNSGEFVLTGELEPERTASFTEIIKEAKRIEPYVTAANITDNPGSFVRAEPLTVAIKVKEETKIEPIFQLTCRDKNRMALASTLLSASAAGIRNILVLTGDHPTLGDVPDSKPVFDLDSAQLLSLAREIVDKQSAYGLAIQDVENCPPQYHVGIGANPNSTNPEIELAKIQRKITIGAEFIQTQVIYELDKVDDFLSELQKFNTPVLVGLFPMRNYSTAYGFNKYVPGVTIPDEILKKLKEVKKNASNSQEKNEGYDKINVELFTPIINELKKKKLAQGLHITAVNYSRIFPQLL